MRHRVEPELHPVRGGTAEVELRGCAVWEAGKRPGVRGLPAGYLTHDIAELPTARPLVVHFHAGLPLKPFGAHARASTILDQQVLAVGVSV